MRNLTNDLVAVIALARNCTRAEAEQWLEECVRQREERRMAEATEQTHGDAEPEPFESDEDCWLCGFRLLLQLQELRYDPQPCVSDNAQRAIRRYCRCVRRSPHCVLARIQRRFRLPDEIVIVALYTFASHAGLRVCGSIDEAILLAYGFIPPTLMDAFHKIHYQHGWGRLFRAWGRQIGASRLLCDMLRPAPWSDDEARRCREQTGKLPTVPYPENRKR